MDRQKVTQRKRQLKTDIAREKKSLKDVLRGHLKLSKSHGVNQFYWITQEGGKIEKTYLAKENEEIIRALAQKSYDIQVLKLAEQELHAWEVWESLMPDMTEDEVYEKLSPVRQKYVTPIRLTDEEYRRQWEAVEYKPGFFREGAPEYRTNRGERVRSKSEIVLANLLYFLDLPYRYEWPVTVVIDGEKKVWRPDFTILDVKNRKEYHLEHFGMLDDQSEDNYARNAFWKMKIYEENGMYEGDKMIYSFETSRAPLDFDYMKQKLGRIFDLKKEV